MLELLANMGLFFMFCKENQKYRMESAFIKGRFSQISLPESRNKKEFSQIQHDYQNYILVLQNLARKEREREEQRQSFLLMHKDLECRLPRLLEEAKSSKRRLSEQELCELQEGFGGISSCLYCKNPIVNEVMEEKGRLCERLGVNLEAELLIPGEISVDSFSLCRLFTNLLDNAIEAAGELEQSKRKVRIRAGMKGGYLLVRVENSSTREHAERKKRRGRGKGIQILKSIVKSYDGVFVANYRKGIYTAVVAVKA
ncbi:MAG: GHKL domain-containing protein [Lachnospiraceae bacterium]|jgi:signal transduction histidine kinase|nr:GHKL domain-containing protein [Lachnospiraceae bacterium]